MKICFFFPPATCLRKRFNCKRRSVSDWFTFWWFYWIISCPQMFAEEVEKEGVPTEHVSCRLYLLFNLFTIFSNSITYLWLCLRGWCDRILAGSVAGFSILALNDSNRRRTLALYLLARLAQVLESISQNVFETSELYHNWCFYSLQNFLHSQVTNLMVILICQCAYNSAKAKNKFHLWGSHWRHGDSLLFAISCAQVFYSSLWCFILIACKLGCYDLLLLISISIFSSCHLYMYFSKLIIWEPTKLGAIFFFQK